MSYEPSYIGIEKKAIEVLSERLDKEGYHLVSEVSSIRLPENIGSYRPDAVFRMADKLLAVEVKATRNKQIERNLEKLRAVFSSDPRWDFRVVYFDEMGIDLGPSVQTNSTISDAISKAKGAMNAGVLEAAFLLGWAAFEAAGRRTFKKDFARPQSPGRLITVLAENGLVTPNQAERLRELAAKRNVLIHGGLNEKINKRDILFLLERVESVQKYSLPPIRQKKT